MKLRARQFAMLPLVVAGIGLSAPAANAERHPHDRVSVSVSYQMSLPVDENEAQAEANLRAARAMIYQQVKQECLDMKSFIAETCKLSKLDIRQSNSNARGRDKQDYVNLQASAKFFITLKPNTK
ncbi:MAG: hypothetical protein AB8C46_11925 [Burkholderiaceae bacterium]